MKPKAKKQQKPIFKASDKGINNKNNIYILIILAITAVVYFKTLGHDFTNWDDETYLHENPYIKDLSLAGIRNIFTHSYFTNYHPATTLTYALEYKFFGLTPWIFHFNNLLLHLINTFLVFLLIKRLSSRIEIPLITAAIFAIHPMHIESVAWIAERKDVLYAFFFLLAAFNYLKYISSNYIKKYYFFTLLFALLAILSKAAAASLPFVLFLFDYYYERKNYKKLIIEKIPFLTLSLIFGIIAITAQSNDPQNAYPIIDKFFLITYAIAYYFINFFAPIRLYPLIEFPEKTGLFFPLQYYVSFLVIPFMGFLIYKIKLIRKEIIFSLSFFILTMLLVLIKFPVGPSYIAERYTYIPYIGMAFLIAVIYIKLTEEFTKRKVLIFMVLWFLFLGVKTNYQITVWKNSETLWSFIIDYNPRSEVAYNNRGLARDRAGNIDGAIADFTKSIEINPESALAYYNRGISKKELGDYKGAIVDFSKAININPTEEDAYYYRGDAKGLTGDYTGAIIDYNKAIEINSEFEKAFTGRGTAKSQLGDLNGAFQDLNKAIKINPHNADAYLSRSIVHSMMKNFNLALKDLDSAIAIDKNNAEAFFTKGIVYLEMNNTSDACIQFDIAKQKGNEEAINMINSYCIQ